MILSVDDPNLYLLVEMFRDREAGDAHVEVPGEGWSAMAEAQRAVDGE